MNSPLSKADLDGDARNLAVLLDVIVAQIVDISAPDSATMDEINRVTALLWIARNCSEQLVRSIEEAADGRAAA